MEDYMYFESHFFQKGNQIFILNICDYSYDWKKNFEKIRLYADKHHLHRGFSVCWDEYKN